ncbi:MAG: glycosyltransferase [Verrucomicrobiota bacterium]
MPHINIIARTNGVGLDQDVILVRDHLEKAGLEVSVSHCRSIPLWSGIFPKKPQFDANVFLERIFSRWLPAGKMNFLIPNQERFPRRHLKYLSNIDVVLCKTQHAEEIFSKYAEAHTIGFSSADRLIAEARPDYTSCLHLAGKSTLKGTETLLELWKNHPDWPVLTLIQCKENAPKSVPDNVRLLSHYLAPDELTKEMNRHGIHLCTSRSEGWGHYIVEAMSAQAVVITTDAPPMNELITSSTGILVPYSNEESRHLGRNFYVDPNELAQALDRVFALSYKDKVALGGSARDWFEFNHKTFARSFPEVVKSLLS